MRCPICNAPDTQVLETRESDEGAVVRRRRRCLACGRRFTTYERAEIKPPTVVKRNGAREPFDRQKLLASLELALRKRPVSHEAIEQAVDRIESELLATGRSEIASAEIGERAMETLKSLDKIGYIRYASVYRNFEDIDAFAQFVKTIKQSRRSRPRVAPLSTPHVADLDLFTEQPSAASRSTSSLPLSDQPQLLPTDHPHEEAPPA
ncbi:MAG: transcriptional regulator NrdR [Hydrogenophilus sp.]|nr:transcriptional regulator NrdR [Hydrogenophilus sp.]